MVHAAWSGGILSFPQRLTIYDFLLMDIIRRLFVRRAGGGSGETPPTTGDPNGLTEHLVSETDAGTFPLQKQRTGFIRRRMANVFSPFSRLSVGLTYEGGVLRILVCEGQKVVSWDAIPFDPRLVSGALVVEPYSLGRFINDAFDRRALPRGRVHCAVPAVGVISRVIEIPHITGRERSRSVKAEAMRALGVSPGRYFVYGHPLDESEDASVVFVLAVPRETLRSIVDTMRAAGIVPRTVDLAPLALARGVGQSDAIILRLDPMGVDLVAVLDDVPLIVRSIAFGEQSLTLEEAQDAAIDLMSTELRRYEDVYVGSRIVQSVPVYLAGDLAGGLRLVDRVRTVTGHPLGRIAPLIDYPEDLPMTDYLVNIGLALKDL